MNAIQNKDLDYEVMIQNERERISSLIHNQLAQDLTAVSIHSEAILSISKNNEVLTHSYHISNLIRNSRDTVKKLIWGIENNCPDFDLIKAVDELMKFWRLTDGRVEQYFRVKGQVALVPHHIRSICYEAAKEAITNVYRHAWAENLAVNMVIKADCIEIFVTDDGIGFDAEYSNGLSGVSMKLKSVRGLLKILSNESGGCTLHISVPFNGGD